MTVLEGRDRIGGRIRSEKLGLSLPADKQRVVDLGASFVCGTSTKPAESHVPVRESHVGVNTQAETSRRSRNAWFDDDNRDSEETRQLRNNTTRFWMNFWTWRV